MKVFLICPPGEWGSFSEAGHHIRQMTQTEWMNPREIEQAISPMLKEDRLRVREALIRASDLIVVVPGWEKAKESCLELGVAKGLGKKIQWLSEEMLAFYREYSKEEDNESGVADRKTDKRSSDPVSG